MAAGTEVLPLVSAAGTVAARLGCRGAALSRVSGVRVEELGRESRPGSRRLPRVLADPPHALGLLPEAGVGTVPVRRQDVHVETREREPDHA